VTEATTGERPDETTLPPATEGAVARPLCIAVADDEPDTREFLGELLTRLGHQVALAGDGRQLVELCRAAPPDLVLTNIMMPEMGGIAAAAEVNRERPVPVVLVFGHHDPVSLARARAEHVVGYLVKPVRPADLEVAIALAMALFEQLQALRREAADLRQALGERKVIDQAKGVVMRRLGVGDEEAYGLLQKQANDTNRKLAEVAREVLAAEGVFGALQGRKRSARRRRRS
jgi:response regulator NasT